MILIAREFIRRRMMSMVLMAVHDEIIWESPIDEMDEAKEVVRHCMTQAAEILETISVPLYVEVNIANRWSEKDD